MKKNLNKCAKLNLGCGNEYKLDFVNLDNRTNVAVDVLHDLEKFPYPFKDNSFKEVYISHVLEHLNNPIKTLRELIRICENGAKIIIEVPHANSYANISSIQHKVNFNEHSFSENHLEEYDLEELKLERFEFTFPTNKWKKFVPFKGFLKIYFNGIYDDLYFELKVDKKGK